MTEFTSNAEANVSAAKGVTGGYCYRAPVGTELPDSHDWRPATEATYEQTTDTELDNAKTYYTRSGSGTTSSPYTYAAVDSPTKSGLTGYYEEIPPVWKCMGYITEDGETFGTTAEVQEFRDQNGDLMDTSQSNYGETFSCSFAETKAATFQSVFSDEDVTDENGTLTVNHSGAEPGIYTYAFLFLLKNGRKWVRFAEKAKRTSIGDTTTNSSNVLAWQADFTVVRSETTDGYFVDMFESTETEAGN